MREQVEVLKNSADLEPQVAHSLAVVAVRNPCFEPHVAALNRSAVDSLQSIQTAQQCRLAASRRADDTEHRFRRDFEVDAFKNMCLAEVLAQTLDPNHAANHALASASVSITRSVARFRKRCSSIRARWAIGRLIAR